MQARILPGVALLLLGSFLAAQSGTLTLQGEGGSFPGRLALELTPGKLAKQAAILLSPTRGPTPLSLINPGDQRVLDVGLSGLFAFSGVFRSNGKMKAPVLTVPNNPAFLDAVIFVQGITLFETPGKIVSRISQPQPLRMAPAGRFHDRRTQFLTPRAFFPVISRRDQRAMMLGGATGALLAQVATKKTEIYDPVSDGFKPGPDMTVERSLHTATRLQDGRWLIVAGVDIRNNPQATAEIYDPVKDSFQAVASMTTLRMGHTASLLPDGRVLVAGGLSKVNSNDIFGTIASTQKSTEIYDPKSNTWTRGPDMNQPRAAHLAITLPGGRILFVGGLGFVRIFIPIPTVWTQCDIYDPKTNRIIAGPRTATPHALPSAVAIGPGRTLIAGGIDRVTLSQPGKVTGVAEIYDATRNAWSSAGTMQSARALHQAFDLGGGKILEIGGATGTVMSPIALASTEVYDVARGTWSAGPSMSASRGAYGAQVTPLGQIHLLGGGSGLTATVGNTTDWFYR